MSPHLSIHLERSILQNYDFSITSTTPIGTGAMSTTMKLVTNQGPLFLKIYKSVDNQKIAREPNHQRIAFTHALQNFLCQGGLPVPRLLSNNKGETFSLCDSFSKTRQIYALFEFIEGHDYEVGNPGQLRASGEMLGLLHQQLRKFYPRIQPAWQPIETEIFAQLQDRLSRLQSVVGKGKTDPVSPSQIKQWLDKAEGFRNSVYAIRNARYAMEWIIHGDYRAQNLKFDGNQIRAILDLDTARPANRLYDLAYTLVFFPAVYQDIPLTANQHSVFLHAYESSCPLSEADREMLPTHLRLAFLRGVTLWLDLYYFAGMNERTRPWIQGYLQQIDETVAF